MSEEKNNSNAAVLPGDVSWIAIARTGTFTDSAGREHGFAKGDLEAIRDAYDPKVHEAPLVYGHPEHDAPAQGWVRALKCQGDRLFAQVAGCSGAARESVRKGIYRYVSMSLAPDKKKLLHVGLLGAFAPAIDGLGPVALASGEGITITFSAPLAHGGSMELADLQRQLEEFKGRMEALTAEVAKLKAEKEGLEKDKAGAEQKAEATAAEFAAYRGEVAGKAREARVLALVDSGRLEPAKKAEVLALASALAEVKAPVNFSLSSQSGQSGQAGQAGQSVKKEELSAEESYFRQLEWRSLDGRFVNFAAPLPGHFSGAAQSAFSPSDITSKM